MANAVKQENYDVRAVSVVRRLATKVAKEGVFHGQVPQESVAFLYAHVKPLGELIHEVLGFDAPPVALSVEKLSKKQLGHYKVGRDGLGLRWRVAINVVHFNRPRGDVVRTLLHEILHAVQHDQGKVTKSAHDLQFRSWSEKLGIPCDKKGHSQGVVEGSPFDLYCKKHKLEGTLKLTETKNTPKAKGSPLKKWTCSCGVNARVATFFDATCNLCGTKFELQEAAV